MSRARSEKQINEALAILDKAVHRRQPMSSMTGLGVVNHLVDASFEERVARNRDDWILQQLVEAIALMYNFAMAETKKRRLHRQWMVWRHLMQLTGKLK